MKNHSALLLLLVSFYIVDSDCGVIENVYGSVANRTQQVRENIHSWWSYGKEMVFGSETEENANSTSLRSSTGQPDGGILASMYHSAVASYQNARHKIHDFFLSDNTDDGDNKGIVRNMYKRVAKKISQARSFIIGGDKMESESNKNSVDYTPFKESITKFLKDQNDKREAMGKRIATATDNVMAGANAAKENVYKAAEDARNHIVEDVRNINEIVKDKAHDAKENMADSFDDYLHKANDLSEKEKEVLTAISNRIRNRFANISNGIQTDMKQLSYGDSY